MTAVLDVRITIDTLFFYFPPKLFIMGRSFKSGNFSFRLTIFGQFSLILPLFSVMKVGEIALIRVICCRWIASVWSVMLSKKSRSWLTTIKPGFVGDRRRLVGGCAGRGDWLARQ